MHAPDHSETTLADAPYGAPCALTAPVDHYTAGSTPPPLPDGQPARSTTSGRELSPYQQRLTGWTPASKRGFLEALARCGNVKSSAAYVSMSREGAYQLKRRDRAFALAWEGAMVQARALAEDDLQDKALNGFTEQLHYHGEVLDTRTRFDGRLLLALLGRLDKRAESEAALLGADRFDDLLMRIEADEDASDLLESPAEARAREEAARQAAARVADDARAAQAAAMAGDADDHMIWEEDGDWWTDYPAPADYDGIEDGRYGQDDYRRTLSEEEMAALDEDVDKDMNERDALARAEAQRRAAFGLDVEEDGTDDDGADDDGAEPQASGSSTEVPEKLPLDSVKRVKLEEAADGGGLPGNPADTPSGGTETAADHSTPVTTGVCDRGDSGDHGMTQFTRPAGKTALALGIIGTAAALTGCATLAGTVGESYNTALVGQQEVPGSGDPDGTGTAKITADATTNQICYDVTVQNISRPTAAHIHKGARGQAGPPVVTLEVPTNGAISKCMGVDKQIAAGIIADPSSYYVNVHTADYPNGAVRGQL